jgi:hypothetical protein
MSDGETKPAPKPDYDALYNRVGREFAEVALKFISWNIMYAAILYAAEKTGSTILNVRSYLVMGLLVIYLNGHVYRIQELFYRRLDIIKRNMLLMLVTYLTVVFGITFGSLYLSSQVVREIVKLQFGK